MGHMPGPEAAGGPDYAREMMRHRLVGAQGILHQREMVAAAGRGSGLAWSVDERHANLVVDEDGEVIAYCTTELVAQHVASADPADGRAEVDLLRQLVTFLADVDDDEMDAAAVAEQALRMIAARFAGEPGYQETWRPEA